MSRPRKLAPDAVSSGEDWLPPMTADERAVAEAALGAAIPHAAWAQVETARIAFVATRRRKAGAVTFSEMKSRLEKMKANCTDFLDRLRPADEIDRAAWARLQLPLDLPLRHVWGALLETDAEVQVGEPLAGPVLTVNALLQRIDAELEILARQESAWTDADRAAAETRDEIDAAGKFRFLDGFIAELAAAAEAAGVTPTASKSSRAKNPRPSPFVAFVRAIIATMPGTDRPASQSDGALAAQCAAALTRWKAHKVLRES